MKKLTLFLTISLLSLSLSLSTASAIFSQGTHFANQSRKYILDNGLTLIIKEDHTSPIVALCCTVKAGSTTEGELSGSGISHFVEHMFFKGTAQRGVGDIARQIREAGGRIGAATAFDYTQFNITVSRPYLDDALDILADALANASFDPEEMEKERNVILNEIRLNEDSPARYLARLFWSTAYIRHPYRLPIIGYREPFLKLTRKDLLDYYHQKYIPNNIVLSIVGDIDREEAHLKVKEAFKDFQRKKIALYAVLSEPPQMSCREITEQRAVNLTHLYIGYHGPDISSSDLYGMDVLANILGEGESSRLNIQLKEKKQLVYSISAFSYTPKDPGIFGITALLDEKNIAAAKQAINQELDKIKQGDISQEELDKAKRIALSDYIFSLQTVESQAGDLSTSEVVTGDFNFSKRYIRGIDSVEINDVQWVAGKYLRPDNLTIAVLVPKKTIDPDKERGIRQKKDSPIKKTVLRNGAILLLKENHSLPIVSIRVGMKGGVRVENQKDNGISLFIARMLLKGTKNRTKEDIDQEIEMAGGTISSYSANNSLGISLDLLSENLETGIDVLIDILANPTFPPQEIDKTRKEILAEIKNNMQDDFYVASKALKSTLFKTHPYRFLNTGTPSSLARVARRDLERFYREYVTSNNMVIAVFGDIDSKKITNMLTKKSRALNRRRMKKIKPPIESKQTNERKATKYMDKSKAILVLGFHGIALDNNDKYIFEVISGILSGQAGRLFDVVREKSALSYSVGSYSIFGLDPGYYVFYSLTTPENIAKANSLLNEQIKLLKTQPVKPKELKRVKSALIGTRDIDLQTNGALAFASALDELYGLGYNNYKIYANKINGVTPQDIIKVANKYFNADTSATIIVLPDKSSSSP